MKNWILGSIALASTPKLTSAGQVHVSHASQHLKVLRDNGFARVRVDGARRLYAVDPEPLRQADEWLDHFRRFWTPHLDALATELARGKRERRQQRQAKAKPSTTEGT